MTTPLLVANDARVAVDGVVRIEAFSLRAEGARWAFAGDVEPLVQLLAAPPAARAALIRAERGEVTLAGGSLVLAGADVGRDAHLGLVGFAACDPPLPNDMTVLEVATWSARLAADHGARGAAPALARKALDVVGMGPASGRFVSTLALPERRALVIALAAVVEPSVLVAETPLAGLEGEAVGFVLAALRAVGDGRSTIVSTRTITGPAEVEIMRWVDGVSLFLGGHLVLHGAAAEVFAHGRLMGLTVRGEPEGLLRRLGDIGVRVSGGPRRFSIALPEGVAARDVLASAAAEGATVVELLPLV